MKSTRLLTIALLFASTAEAQSLFNNYQLMNLAQAQDFDLVGKNIELESLDVKEDLTGKELEQLQAVPTEVAAAATVDPQSLTSKAASTVMDGMKHFTTQLEELIKDKVEAFTSTMLAGEKDKAGKKEKKSHKKHRKAKKQKDEDSSTSEEE